MSGHSFARECSSLVTYMNLATEYPGAFSRMHKVAKVEVVTGGGGTLVVNPNTVGNVAWDVTLTGLVAGGAYDGQTCAGCSSRPPQDRSGFSIPQACCPYQKLVRSVILEDSPDVRSRSSDHAEPTAKPPRSRPLVLHDAT